MFAQVLSHNDPTALLAEPGVLAVVSFEPRCEATTTLGNIPVGLNALSGPAYEVIRYGQSPAKRGTLHDCQWNEIDDVLCLSTWIPEAECDHIGTATEAAYLRLYRVLEARGFSQVFRIWNYMPNINSGEGDSEEYKQFCVGRQRAFDALALEPQDFPAASALGHHSRGAVIYLLATRHAGQHHENPLQQSAYEYPREYGPSSPSFARATSMTLGGEKQIFISGTAAILGHATQSPGDIDEQLKITIANIDTLLAGVAAVHSPLQAVRVYLRHEYHLAAAQEAMALAHPHAEVTFLLADICRANLLVEIEAACLAQSP